MDRARGTPITRGNYAERPHCYESKTREMHCRKDGTHTSSGLVRPCGAGSVNTEQPSHASQVWVRKGAQGISRGPCSQKRGVDLGLLATSWASLQEDFAYALKCIG